MECGIFPCCPAGDFVADSVCDISLEEKFTLFGHEFNTSVFIFGLADIFDLIRLYFNKLERESSLNATDNRFVQWRYDLNIFYNVLESFVMSIRASSNVTDESCIKKVLFELHGFLLDAGHLHKLPLNVKESCQNRTKPSFAPFVYFHACLDLWCKTLKIISIIYRYWPNVECVSKIVKSFNTDDLSDTNLSNFLKLLIYDLTLLGFSNYKEESNCTDVWLYPCLCVEEFWYKIKQMSNDLFKERQIQNSFSKMLQSVVSQYSSENPLEITDVSSDQFHVPLHLSSPYIIDKGYFCWNLVRNLQRLKDEENFICPTIDSLMKSTVVNLLNSKPKICIETEQKVRRYLSTYLHVSSVDNGRVTSSVYELLDSFIRHIDESFFGGSSLDELLVDENISVKECLENIKSLNDRSKTLHLKTSFDLFLRILATHCDADKKFGKTIRGRAFSKFHPDRVNSLSERGLMNFFELFLFLAYQTGLNEVTVKIFDYFSTYDSRDAKFAEKNTVMCKNFFLLSMIYQEKRSDGSLCTATLRRIFDGLASRYKSAHCDMVVRKNIWSCMMLFLKFLHEYFENAADFEFGENELLDVIDLESILKSAKSEDDLKRTDITTIFKLWYSVSRRICSNFAAREQTSSSLSRDFAAVKLSNHLLHALDVVHSKVIPICKQFLGNFIQLTPSLEELSAHLWSSLTLAAFYKKGKRLDDDVISYVDFYIWNSNISGINACRYLANLLLIDVLSLENTKVLTVWIRCLLTIPSDVDATLKHVTSFVAKENVLPKGIVLDLESSSTPLDFIKVLCKTANEQTSMLLFWRNFFDQPVRFVIDLLIKQDISVKNVFFHHYHVVVSILVENCAYILHRRDDPRSLLKGILDQTVLFSGKLSASEKETKYNAINEVFVPIVRGIIKKFAWLTDTYLRHSLCHMYKLAFDRLANVDSASNNLSILLDPLRETFAGHVPDDSSHVSFRTLCVKSALVDLFDQQMTPSSSKSESINLLLTFYGRLIESTKDDRLLVEESRDLLAKIFLVWIHRCNDSLHSLFSDVLINTACCRLVQIPNGTEIVIESVKQILHSHLLQHPKRVLRILENLNRNSKIRASFSMKSVCSNELVEIDRKTGGSVDSKLWSVVNGFT